MVISPVSLSFSFTNSAVIITGEINRSSFDQDDKIVGSISAFAERECRRSQWTPFVLIHLPGSPVNEQEVTRARALTQKRAKYQKVRRPVTQRVRQRACRPISLPRWSLLLSSRFWFTSAHTGRCSHRCPGYVPVVSDQARSPPPAGQNKTMAILAAARDRRYVLEKPQSDSS